MPALDLDHLNRKVYWWDTVSVKRRAPLSGSETADVVIVGAGFTGLWTAYQLKRAQPSLDIVVLERDFAGAGASGHNDGFAIALIDLSLSALLSNWGPEQGGIAREAMARSVVEIGEFCSQHGVDSSYRRAGFLAIARNSGERARLKADYDAARKLGIDGDFQLLDGDDARGVLGSPRVQSILREGCGAQLNPLALAQGIAEVVETLGVKLYDGTPVLDIVPGEPVICRTERAEVRAAQCVVATNASAWRHPQWRRKVLPFWSYALVSKPLTDEQIARVPWESHIGYEDKRTFVSDGRLTPDHRFLCGGAEARYFYGNSMEPHHADFRRPYEQLDRDAMDLFPMWSDIEWDYAYAGCMGMTPTFIPYFGSLGRNLHYGLAYNGHGVAASHTGGKVLRDLALGRKSEYTELFFLKARQPSWPPEPVRFIGARLTSSIALRHDLALHRLDGARAMEPRIMRFNRRIFRP